jgi:hypothetical protein
VQAGTAEIGAQRDVAIAGDEVQFVAAPVVGVALGVRLAAVVTPHFGQVLEVGCERALKMSL